MLALTIKITGKKDRDLEIAAEEVLSLVRRGFLSGQGRNDTGSFLFDIAGEDEPDSDEEHEEEA